MSCEVHVRFCEGLGLQCPGLLTRVFAGDGVGGRVMGICAGTRTARTKGKEFEPSDAPAAPPDSGRHFCEAQVGSPLG